MPLQALPPIKRLARWLYDLSTDFVRRTSCRNPRSVRIPSLPPPVTRTRKSTNLLHTRSSPRFGISKTAKDLLGFPYRVSQRFSGKHLQHRGTRASLFWLSLLSLYFARQEDLFESSISGLNIHAKTDEFGTNDLALNQLLADCLACDGVVISIACTDSCQPQTDCRKPESFLIKICRLRSAEAV